MPPGNVLTGTDLGGRTLSPGAYGFSSSAQLTGQLTLDAHGDPSAQFVFVIGTTLTTATASSVVLVNGASPCNVFWKVGSSATLGTSTAFAGNVLALTTISLNSSVTVLGRLLARNGEVTLINDVLTKPNCATGSGSEADRDQDRRRKPRRQKTVEATSGHKGTAKVTRGRSSSAVTATVSGKRIDTVKFTENGKSVGAPGANRVRLPSTPGIHQVKVHVTFTDSTKPKTFTFRFRVPSPTLHPASRPLAVHRMSKRQGRSRRVRGGVLAGLLALAIGGGTAAHATAAPARASAAPVSQDLVVLLGNHIARRAPSASAAAIEAVPSRRPLTRTRTVLPVLDRAGPGADWLRVRLPGRPNGHSGWISVKRTRATATEWRIRVALSKRRVIVFRAGRVIRSFPAIIGKRSTPTPRGSFFVEEALRLLRHEPGAPYALATSARSNALQEFDGGPGQIALHGTGNLSGSIGSAVSHGCVRLRTRAIAWLATRIGAGVPVTIGR